MLTHEIILEDSRTGQETRRVQINEVFKFQEFERIRQPIQVETFKDRIELELCHDCNKYGVYYYT